MTKIDWSRPRDRIRGRATESVRGEDLTLGLLPTRGPQSARPSKADLRRQAEQAVADFYRRRRPVDDDVRKSGSSGPKRPPWDGMSGDET